MVQFALPKNDRVVKGVYHKLTTKATNIKVFEIYRFDPNNNENPRLDSFEINLDDCGPMILDALMKIKNEIDDTLVFRRSCREGICGSCTFNINGKNSLACTKKINEYSGNIKIYPLPHKPVIKDLVVDLTTAYAQHESVKPWLIASSATEPNKERLQTPQQREKIDGLWECIMCFACTTSCPSYWWKGDNGYLGPATLLHAYRWIQDSRDEANKDRLQELNNETKLFSCHTIMNCMDVCPKGLNPAQAIADIKRKLVLS